MEGLFRVFKALVISCLARKLFISTITFLRVFNRYAIVEDRGSYSLNRGKAP